MDQRKAFEDAFRKRTGLAVRSDEPAKPEGPVFWQKLHEATVKPVSEWLEKDKEASKKYPKMP